MKSLLKTGVLSARLEATDRINPGSLQSGAFDITMLLLIVLLGACDGKINGQGASQHQTQIDSVAKPKVDIKVNRRYDEKGNMIGFDSTYTSYYSNVIGDTAKMDTLMRSFDRYFIRDHSTFFKRQFDPLFFSDSLRYPDFFHDDFFMKRYELNDPYFRQMMHQMDSIKNRFYKDRHTLAPPHK